jgi:uncharacterized protein (TIGR00369 family)
MDPIPRKDDEDISLTGFNRHVGPLHRLASTPDGTERFAFTVEAKHMNASAVVHGGMLMAFIDVAMSHSARSAAGGAALLSTVALNCDFVSPARLGDTIEARVRVNRCTRSVVFLSGQLFAEECLLLAATGLWKIAGSR